MNSRPLTRLVLPIALAILLVQEGPGAWAQERAPVRFQNVVVRPGDTLWGIANTYLKDPTRWNVILRYNKLPSSDPTVALPGMTLRVPIALIKENLRAALLIFVANQVLFRKKESADWKATQLKMQLFRDDGLRTLADSRARVQFISGDVLSLDQNSMAILKPMSKEKDGADLELVKGGIVAAHAKTITVSAKITPKTQDTRYSADLRDDLSTHVEVYMGRADVEGGGSKVAVDAGYGTDVGVNGIPTPPLKIPDMPRLAERIADSGILVRAPSGRGPGISGFSVEGGAMPGGAGARLLEEGESRRFAQDMKALNIGVPIAAYRVQASDSEDFNRILFDREFDSDEKLSLNRTGLAPGTYFWRVAIIDLLGAQGKFSPPRRYHVSSR